MSTGDPAAIAHHQTMDKLNSFMRDRNFPDALKTRLRTYHHNSRDIAKSAGYQQLIDNLSPDLKADVTVRNAFFTDTKKRSAFHMSGSLPYINRRSFEAKLNQQAWIQYKKKVPYRFIPGIF